MTALSRTTSKIAVAALLLAACAAGEARAEPAKVFQFALQNGGKRRRERHALPGLTRNRRKIDSGKSAELGAGWRLNFARHEKLFLKYIL